MKKRSEKILLVIFVIAFCACLSLIAQAKAAVPEGEKFYVESLQEELEAALQSSGIRPPLSVDEVVIIDNGLEKILSEAEARKLYSTEKFSLSKLEINDAASRFTAEVVGQADHEKITNKPLNTLTIRGKISKFSEIPVLKNTMSTGQVITEEDIEMVRFEDRKVRANEIVDAGMLIGKTPTQRITANRPIRSREVTMPVVVHKGDVITLVYQTESMRLQTTGYAQENGRIGEYIRIENANSKKVVRGKVEDKGMATVQPTVTPEIASNL